MIQNIGSTFGPNLRGFLILAFYILLTRTSFLRHFYGSRRYLFRIAVRLLSYIYTHAYDTYSGSQQGYKSSPN